MSEHEKVNIGLCGVLAILVSQGLMTEAQARYIDDRVIDAGGLEHTFDDDLNNFKLLQQSYLEEAK